MNILSFHRGDRLRSEAADWVVQLESGVADADAFDAWLQASRTHGRAFDVALEVSHLYAQHAAPVAAGLSARRRLGPRADRRLLVAGAAAAAAVAGLMVTPQLTASRLQVYETARGERRMVTLADHSTLHLNGATRVVVKLSRGYRDVDLRQGEVIFDVAHNAARPFRVAVGDRTVRVVGTQFDVRRLAGKLSVTVARGAVEVRPTTGSGTTYRLRPGQRLDHVEGAVQVRLVAVEPAEIMSWQAGRLILRDKPLGEVVEDLNQQFVLPIRVDDPGLAAMPVSGVLVLDSQDAVIHRLALLAPIRAVRSGAGIGLRRDTGSSR